MKAQTDISTSRLLKDGLDPQLSLSMLYYASPGNQIPDDLGSSSSAFCISLGNTKEAAVEAHKLFTKAASPPPPFSSTLAHTRRQPHPSELVVLIPGMPLAVAPQPSAQRHCGSAAMVMVESETDERLWGW